MGNIKEKKIHIAKEDVEGQGQLRPEMLLDHLQNIAMEQSEELGLGIEFLERENLNWLLLCYKINIERMPSVSEGILVRTWASSFSKMFARREFLMLDSKGNILIEASTKWLLTEGDTHKIKKIDDMFYDAYGVDRDKKDERGFKKLRLPENNLMTGRKKSEERDIDFNGHVNNTRYIAWAMESLPEEFRRDNILYEIDIEFKKEILLGEDIEVLSEVKTDGEAVIILQELRKENKETACCINTVWKRREFVCYCSHVTKRDIEQAVDRGASSVEEVIEMTGAMKNSNCKVNNPKGRCCRKDIEAVFENYRKQEGIEV